MPRSNSNNKALNIHVILLCSLILAILPIHCTASAQYFNQEAKSQPQEDQDPAIEESVEKEEATDKKNRGTDSPIVELIKSSQTKKSQMRSKDWNNKKYKKKVAKERKLEKEQREEIEADEKAVEDVKEELTEESRKIWKHYNELAKRIKKKKEDSKKADKSEEEKEENTDEAKNEDEKEVQGKDKTTSSGGINEILQRYKETQKNQGPMNSRSFGSID